MFPSTIFSYWNQNYRFLFHMLFPNLSSGTTSIEIGLLACWKTKDNVVKPALATTCKNITCLYQINIVTLCFPRLSFLIETRITGFSFICCFLINSYFCTGVVYTFCFLFCTSAAWAFNFKWIWHLTNFTHYYYCYNYNYYYYYRNLYLETSLSSSGLLWAPLTTLCVSCLN